MRDIISGSVPDIVLFGYTITPEPFIKSDAFVDLYDFIDRDKKYNRAAFVPCVLEPFETGNGKLPYLTLTYSLNTLVGKASRFSEYEAWAISEMSDFSASLGEGQLALRINEGVSKPVELLKLFLPGILSGCIDYEAGVCDFSDEFAKLLELCRDMPVLYQSGFASPTMYNNDELLLCQMDISGFIEYMFIKSISFPDAPITPIGYPRAGDGNGAVIEPAVSLAITKQSRQPEGAWKFISFCLDSQIEDWRSSSKNANSSMSLLGRGRPRGQTHG